MGSIKVEGANDLDVDESSSSGGETHEGAWPLETFGEGEGG